MEKYYCDKCGNNMEFDYLSIEFSDSKSIIGRTRISLNLCKQCKKEILYFVKTFVPKRFEEQIKSD